VVAYTSGGEPQLWVNAPDEGNFNLSPFYTVTTTPYFISDFGDGPLDIYDLNYTVEYSYMSDCGTLVDLSVDVDITHTYRGDLGIELYDVNGNSATLHDFSGGTLNDVTGTYTMDGTGSLTSVDSLSVFSGQYQAGYWTLEVYDDSEGDEGTLNNFSLTATCY
jgi:subtilisin-like proprotein convertase family protein